MKKIIYKHMQIHYVTGNSKYQARWKYDVYDDEGRYAMSLNTLRECKEYITNLIWVRRNVPF